MPTPHLNPLNLAMIGGGQGAFIGAVHRMAANLDGHWRLTAGALSSNPAKSKASAQELGLDPTRSYDSWQSLLAGEQKLPQGTRADAISIVTPNNTHFEIATACLDAGFNVILDKPMVTTLAHARALRNTVQRTKRILALTYNYSAYPLVQHAAHLIRSGSLGKVRKAVVEYHQGWLATPLEQTSAATGGQKQASWRTNPALAGAGGCIGDIGTHAEQLLRTVTGLHIESLSAQLTSFVPNRTLDDDAAMLLNLRDEKGHTARATLSVSQVCVGEENNLTLRVYCEKGSLWWNQENPNQLKLATLDGTTQLITRGTANSPAAQSLTRLPPGHPEGFLEAFANIYNNVALHIHQQPHQPYPTVEDGIAGLAFIEAAIQSNANSSVWTPVPN